MALHNDSRLYSGGSVVLNSQPSVNLYAQMMQRKQAREEALDEYEKNRINRMNEAGLRDQDREGLDNKVLELKGYYNANKDAIRKGNTPQGFEYEKKFRDAMNYIGESKDRSARSEAFMKFREERLKNGRMLPEEAWHEYKAHELPIGAKSYDPETGEEIESKSIDLPKYMSQASPKFDQQKALKLFSGIKKNQTITEEAIPGKPDQLKQITTATFDDDGKVAISHIAGELYDNDDGFAMKVQEAIKNPLKRGELEKTFEEQFKTKPQSQRDFAIADMMQQIQQTSKTEKVVPNWKYRTDVMQRNKERNILLNANAQRNAKGGTTSGNAFDDIPDTDFKGFSVKGGMFLNADGTPKNGNVFITGEVIPSSIKSALNAGGIDAKLLTNGVDAVIKDGKIQSVSNKKIGTVTRDAMENVYQRKFDTEPLKGEHLKFNEASTEYKPLPKSKGVVKKIYKYNGKDYSIEQIQKAAKQNNMTIEEYIKAAGLK